VTYAYVELKEPKYFRSVGEGADKHGVEMTTASATKTNLLFAETWDMQQSGAVLILRHKASGAVYHCPFADVKLALGVRETEKGKGAEKGKAAQ
jgi:hypothetical protein